MSGAAIPTIRAARADPTAINIDAVDIADLPGRPFHWQNLKFRRAPSAWFNFVFTRIINHYVTVFGD